MAPEVASLDSVLRLITASNNPVALHHSIKNVLPKDTREAILSSSTSDGRDPLALLDVRQHTLGMLWIITAPPLILDFCQHFEQAQARAAPDRIAILAKNLPKYGSRTGLGVRPWCLNPLRTLIMRYPIDPSHLTPIHPVYIWAVHEVRNHAHAKELLLHYPITDLDASAKEELNVQDCLMYAHLAGMTMSLLALSPQDSSTSAKTLLASALSYYTTCITHPGNAVSAMQLESLKHMRLVECIGFGETSSLPKYTSAVLQKMYKNTPYHAFVAAYPQDREQLKSIFEKYAPSAREKGMWAEENTLSLMHLALDAQPKWALKRLTETYVTLGLADIGRAIGVKDEGEVRALVLSMIESEAIHATIAGSTVTFVDPVRTVSKAQIDAVLRAAQQQGSILEGADRQLGANKDFLSKAVRNRHDMDDFGGGAYGGDEDIMGGPMPEIARGEVTAGFVDDGMFSAQ
ncbi:hypothetical protein BD626DRAFT_507623 [Schizophyllum amplum]|uniref:COP9 signalosome complex subunit 3 N-terminal helical repeats domain-containing protein n=1 Tax=Schizophyllum amplum TaxID=97359 RepID=A0A550C456_9AGAR|nr:hypothetical protein BD626DRAFT_507623 [Auriculariopsis ampla]